MRKAKSIKGTGGPEEGRVAYSVEDNLSFDDYHIEIVKFKVVKATRKYVYDRNGRRFNKMFVHWDINKAKAERQQVIEGNHDLFEESLMESVRQLFVNDHAILRDVDGKNPNAWGSIPIEPEYMPKN